MGGKGESEKSVLEAWHDDDDDDDSQASTDSNIMFSFQIILTSSF